MDKKELAAKLSNVMDIVNVCEGLIYADLDGKVIIGQTILEEIDHGPIAKAFAAILAQDLSESKKGNLNDAMLGLDEGMLIGVKSATNIVIGILGDDGKASSGLLRKQLQNLMSEL